MFHSTATSYRRILFPFFLAVFITAISSCTVVKEHPVRTPFVYDTNIEVEGNLSTDEKKQLTSQLREQLHDSIRVRTIQKLIGWENGPRLFYTQIVNPAVYDSLNADKSVQFMRALLNSLGYYRDTISYDTSLLVKGDQYRTEVNFHVYPGKLVRLDSIRYNVGRDSLQTDTSVIVIGNDTLQQITLSSLNESLLKKGVPFAKPLISSEFNRLVDVYRNNGYLRFSFDDLLAVWDTVGLALLRPTLDPIEQARQLQELQRRRANPTADLEVRLRAKQDTAHLTRYYVGDVTVYPDLTADTGLYVPGERIVNGYKIISYFDLFKPKVLTENISLRTGDLYSQRNYLRTINRFNSLGAWRLVTVDQVPREGTDTVDFLVKLTPARKYLFDVNVEGSKNWGNPIIIGDLGIGTNIGLQNRNFARRANHATTNLRYGIELNVSDELLQTNQVSVSHNISFPRFIPRIKSLPQRFKDNTRTVFSANVGNIDRRDFFNLSTFNTSWGYEYNWKNKLLNLRFPNIEYSFLNARSYLDILFATNASYRYIFNSGLITSMIANYTISNSKENVTSLTRFNIEGSGLISGFVRSRFLDSNLYRFIKLDAEYRQTYKIRRTEFAWRAFAGSGIGLPRFGDDKLNQYLPFFRQYSGGGSNSMRAWALRKLGPGSANRPFDRTEAPDRFGDLQLELNAEYRFYLADISGVTLNSAFFTDIGNVWFLRKNEDFPDGEFRFDKFFHDLAIGVGTGLRVDFGLFLIRLDYAYKVKDPSPEDPAVENKWFYDWKLKNGQFQLGVNYPF
jgi:outer membrane protein assembly factor BamA